MYMPQIIEKVGRNKKAFDIVSKLYEQSAIMMFEEIDSSTSFKTITQLLYLDSIETDEPVKLYINSPGGKVTSGLAIIDTINVMSRKVDTVGIGECSSMAAVILLMGTGNRRALKNTRVMLHSVSSGFFGNYHDHVVDFKETEFLQNSLMKMISQKLNLPIEEVTEMTKRDAFFSAEECVKIGILDSII